MKFSDLKKKSSDFTDLLKKVDELNKPTYEKDSTLDYYWKPTPDKAGNALAVIRFLPEAPVDGDNGLCWVQYWDHGFQNKETGKWYIEKSLTTLGPGIKDPVSEYNSVLWGDQSNHDPNYRVEERKQVREQKRRLHYVSNIYVVSDPKNPENEGKVFLFKYGKKIHDKLIKMMRPDLESEEAINPFSLWEGANFKLKMTRISGYPNYDESTFLTPGPLTKDEEELEKIWNSEYSLLEIVNPKNFKSYDQLKARLEDVLGEGVSPVTRSSAPQPRGTAVSDQDDDIPFPDSKPTKKSTAPVVEDDDEDPDLEEFRKLIRD